MSKAIFAIGHQQVPNSKCCAYQFNTDQAQLCVIARCSVWPMARKLNREIVISVVRHQFYVRQKPHKTFPDVVTCRRVSFLRSKYILSFECKTSSGVSTRPSPDVHSSRDQGNAQYSSLIAQNKWLRRAVVRLQACFNLLCSLSCVSGTRFYRLLRLQKISEWQTWLDILQNWFAFGSANSNYIIQRWLKRHSR